MMNEIEYLNPCYGECGICDLNCWIEKPLNKITMQTIYEAKAAQKTKPVTERIKTFEDACRELGIEKLQLGVVGLDDDNESIIAYSKLIIIIRALNEGWVPDWTDENQYKYLPWFVHKSGFGLACDDYDYWYSNSLVGSRLCFKSRELAEYTGKQFADIYNSFLSIK